MPPTPRTAPAATPTGATEPLSPTDMETVTEQLGRVPRGARAVAYRCPCGAPAVVETVPRLADGTPFPTTYYLTCPRLAGRLGGLEASGIMREMTDRLATDADLAARYAAAHADYLARRRRLGWVPEIDGGPAPEAAPKPGDGDRAEAGAGAGPVGAGAGDGAEAAPAPSGGGRESERETGREVSAGGMPRRVKCLHALVGHALAAGPGVNPFGDEALAAVGEWWRSSPCALPAADRDAPDRDEPGRDAPGRGEG